MKAFLDTACKSTQLVWSVYGEGSVSASGSSLFVFASHLRYMYYISDEAVAMVLA